MARMRAPLVCLLSCCGLSTPAVARAEPAADAAAADHISLLQRRAVASRSSVEVPEPLTMLAHFADEDLHLRVEPHPRRAWRKAQGLPVTQKHTAHARRKEKASLYSAAEAGPRHLGKPKARQAQGAWAARAARVAEQLESEEMEMAKATVNASIGSAEVSIQDGSQAMKAAKDLRAPYMDARAADLAEIQSLFEHGSQASKAAKDHASQLWRREADDKDTTQARESPRQEVLAETAQATSNEDLAESAQATSNVSVEAADLAEIQIPFGQESNASKAAKDGSSQLSRREADDKNTIQSREIDRQEALDAESAFEAELEAESAYHEDVRRARDTPSNASIPAVQPALLSEMRSDVGLDSGSASIPAAQPALLSEMRSDVGLDSLANSTASVASDSGLVVNVSEAAVHSHDAVESGPASNTSVQARDALPDSDSSQPLRSDNATGTNADASAFSMATSPANATQAPLSNIANSTGETSASKPDILLHEELKAHLALNTTFAGNASPPALLEGAEKNANASVAVLAASPAHSGNASTSGSVAQQLAANVSDAPPRVHAGDTAGRHKFVFEIDGKNVSAVQALRAKANAHAMQPSETDSAVAIAPGAYYVVNARRQKYLSTLGAGVSVVEMENSTSDEEHSSGLQWRFDAVKGKSNTFHVVSVPYQQYLNTLGGPAQLWAPAHQRDAARGGPQSLEWRLRPAGQADTYYLVNEGKHQYMAARNGTVSIWRGQSLEDLGAEPGNIQWRLERAETQAIKDCEAYVSAKDPGCLWTGNWSCPVQQPAGVRGVAGGKGGLETIGFRCCCNLGLWAAPYAAHAPAADGHSF